jgi:hypothetical protein
MICVVAFCIITPEEHTAFIFMVIQTQIVYAEWNFFVIKKKYKILTRTSPTECKKADIHTKE